MRISDHAGEGTAKDWPPWNCSKSLLVRICDRFVQMFDSSCTTASKFEDDILCTLSREVIFAGGTNFCIHGPILSEKNRPGVQIFLKIGPPNQILWVSGVRVAYILEIIEEI